MDVQVKSYQQSVISNSRNSKKSESLMDTDLEKQRTWMYADSHGFFFDGITGFTGFLGTAFL